MLQGLSAQQAVLQQLVPTPSPGNPAIVPHVMPGEEEDDPPATGAATIPVPAAGQAGDKAPATEQSDAVQNGNPLSPPEPIPHPKELAEKDSIDQAASDAQKVETKTPPPKTDESTPIPAPKKEDPKPESPGDVPVKPDAPPLTDAERDALLKQRMLLSKVRSPDELIQYLRETWQARNYRAAAMAMAFEKTNYGTEDLRRACLANWSEIIDRIESVYPRNFPTFSDRTDRLFRTADSQITLEFVRDSNDCWQLGPQTIALTDEIYGDVRNDPPIYGDWLSRNVPAWMHQVCLGLSYFRWTLILISLVVGVLVYWIVQRVLYLVMRAYLHVRYREVTRQSRTVWKQFGLIAMAYVWFYSFRYIVANPTALDFAYFIFSVFVAVMMILIAVKIVDLLSEALRVRIIAKNQYSPENVESLIVPFFSRTLKVLIVCVAIGWLAKQFGWPLAAVVSGMGIGGIAIAFAAKETVANLFGSVTVMIDRPFEIGDWIETNGVKGTVVSVGMRSTRIDTGDFSTVTIPNNNLTTAVINNLGRRRNRRFKIFLGVQYDTPIDRIDAFCEGLKELVMKNAFTVKEGFFIGLSQLGPSSIDILFNVVLVCPSSDTENRERAKLIRNILRLAEAMDVRFAFPSQMLYVVRDKSDGYEPLPGVNSIEIGRDFVNRLLFPQQAANDENKKTGE